MLRLFAIILMGIITSFFIFPIVFTFFPYANTKMILALLGLILLLLRITRQGQKCNKDFLIISLLALGVSLSSLASMILNNTGDYSYLTYIISMWVWLGAAYFVANMIKKVHGEVSVALICLYLVGVAVFQCVIAILIDMYDPIKDCARLFMAGDGFMGHKEGRLYGIGCSTDVGGGRLAAILVMNMFLIIQSLKKELNWKYSGFLFATFVIISVLGNMIARTTTVGMIMSIIWCCLYVYMSKDISVRRKQYIGGVFGLGLVLVWILFSYLYITDEFWRQYLRFGFEGFFSLAERGEWVVSSNEMLKEGYVFPDNFKTWVIGDGYMVDPDIDPYYIGPESWGYYMNTDVGYSRFIFYFGLIGLCLFSLFFVKISQISIKRFNCGKWLFIILLVLNFCIWMKVTTDIFVAFALFLCVSKDDNDEYETRRQLEMK